MWDNLEYDTDVDSNVKCKHAKIRPAQIEEKLKQDSRNRFDQLVTILDNIKNLIDNPIFYVNDYFNELKTKIDLFSVKQLISDKDDKSKEEANKRWNEIINFTQVYENECIQVARIKDERFLKFKLKMEKYEKNLQEQSVIHRKYFNKTKKTYLIMENEIKMNILMNKTPVFMASEVTKEGLLVVLENSWIYTKEVEFFYQMKNFDELARNNLKLVLIIHNQFKKLENFIEKPTLKLDLAKIEEVDLSMKKIITLDENFFTSLRFKMLKKLYLHDNKIGKLNSKIFSSLTNLEDLYLDENELQKLNPNLFRGLTSLKVLSLSWNQIKFIDPKAFRHLNKLYYLNLEHNNLVNLDSATFNGLDNLEELNLSNNEIKCINMNLFQNFSHLKLLSLNNNRLDQIESQLFDNLISLNYLNLAYNRIRSIEENSFVGLSSLSKLILNSNKIEYLNEKSLNGLNKLKLLNLNFNKISHFNASNSLKKLEILLLNYNQIENILNETSLDNANGLLLNISGNLRDLYLESNRIKCLNENAFGRLSTLRCLSLKNNQILTLESNSFYGLTSLNFLIASQNCLKNFNKGTFRGLDNLKKLCLNYNKIESLEEGTFCGLNNLYHLCLFNNKISNLNTQCFEKLCKLESLKLDSNLIEKLKDSIIYVKLKNVIKEACYCVFDDRY